MRVKPSGSICKRRIIMYFRQGDAENEILCLTGVAESDGPHTAYKRLISGTHFGLYRPLAAGEDQSGLKVFEINVENSCNGVTLDVTFDEIGRWQPAPRINFQRGA